MGDHLSTWGDDCETNATKGSASDLSHRTIKKVCATPTNKARQHHHQRHVPNKCIQRPALHPPRFQHRQCPRRSLGPSVLCARRRSRAENHRKLSSRLLDAIAAAATTPTPTSAAICCCATTIAISTATTPSVFCRHAPPISSHRLGERATEDLFVELGKLARKHDRPVSRLG